MLRPDTRHKNFSTRNHLQSSMWITSTTLSQWFQFSESTPFENFPFDFLKLKRVLVVCLFVCVWLRYLESTPLYDVDSLTTTNNNNTSLHGKSNARTTKQQTLWLWHRNWIKLPEFRFSLLCCVRTELKSTRRTFVFEFIHLSFSIRANCFAWKQNKMKMKK